MVKAIVKISDEGIVLDKCIDSEFCSNLGRLGYIRDNIVEPLEVAYQASLGTIEFNGLSGWEASLQILSMLRIRLSLFLVYHDLRTKGKRVKARVKDNTLLIPLSPGKVLEILVLEEGVHMTLEGLAEWSRGVQALNHIPIIAIVDKTGVITYYEARTMTQLI
ncbi:MAG: hypothetical protein QXR02_01170 [Acidilobaceae archaeon]